MAEDEYTVTDAVVVGTLLHALLRRCDRVTIGCQAQLVNVLGLLRSEPAGPAWAQTIALPFEEVRRLAVGESLQVAFTGDRSTTARYGDVPVVDAAATWDEESRALAVFAANRDPSAATTVDVPLAGFGELTVAGARVLGGGLDGAATNSLEFPDRVRLRPLPGVTPTGGGLHLELPPLSWSVARLTGRAAGPRQRGGAAREQRGAAAGAGPPMLSGPPDPAPGEHRAAGRPTHRLPARSCAPDRALPTTGDLR